MRSNCILWAYALRRRRRTKGKRGRIYWRMSMWGPFPHALYGETINGKLRVVSYKPINPRHKALPPPVFAGKVEWGDK